MFEYILMFLALCAFGRLGRAGTLSGHPDMPLTITDSLQATERLHT
jgi:hypothetical protein